MIRNHSERGHLMDTIRIGDSVRFTSPEDGREYVGTVTKLGMSGVATVWYAHDYGTEKIEQSECIRSTRLVRA
ncbi:hypothetical protein SEA_PARLIAMENT_87 [Mycobacterium phage Parliament]|nr:hypothetical protein SEA_PARLIAMENT_87 [Mycobacterium phage Parliament]